MHTYTYLEGFTGDADGDIDAGPFGDLWHNE